MRAGDVRDGWDVRGVRAAGDGGDERVEAGDSVERRVGRRVREDGYARARDGVVDVVAEVGLEVKRDEDCFARAAEVAARRAADDASGCDAKRVKEEDPKPMDSTTLDGDEVYVYGALRQGVGVEVSSSADAAPEFWRVGSVVSANFNAAPRARIEYDDDKAARGVFSVGK